ncbi:897_t:CDS:2 [Cetraspora pellucida]|uniref:897_t:CDS:1 n=1 Tax=Cetraspora pellucida TaxID=1433469 RepID=A0ACA9K1Q8_9GLOM|nr:897_t:CDS:2 [Cetraspora pellucida]
MKFSLNISKVEICLTEASYVLLTNKKICDNWDKLIKLIKNANMQLLRKLTKGKVEEVKKIEEDFNKIPVFNIQVVEGTMIYWVMTMLFGAFYFI